jgi:glycogen phosphorylase
MFFSRRIQPIAYFCSEFAIDSDLPTYAGGLGVLAGDLMKEAADTDFPMVGVGILYKGKEFIQHITGDGKQEQRDSQFDHDTSFLRPITVAGKKLEVVIQLDGYDIKIRVYHIRLADTTVQLFLSTDVDSNPSEWRSDVDALYRGDANSQIRQQIVLGVGGVKVLRALDIHPKTYHINEGRPEFIIWELTDQLMEEKGIVFEEAWQTAVKKIVYTNHTLVAAGNLEYPYETVRNWALPFAKKLGADVDRLIKDGKNDNNFSITKYALNISSKQSAVSKIHAKCARKQWPETKWNTITNGIHMPSWQDSDFRNPKITDEEIWKLHMIKKNELARTVVERTGFGYDPSRLVVTWARRLAEYKQPLSIFEDIKRLKEIVSREGREVQVLYAGNSHSGDAGSKFIIETIIDYFAKDLSGHAIFIPNYNTSLANHLVSGSDIWLNTPKGTLEACGTSGMKAIANGCLNCTVLDGWTYEVQWDDVGWVLDPGDVAKSFYKLMEKEIVGLYYDRDHEGIPRKWVERMRKSIDMAENFSAKRMLEEYKSKLYL